jgi:hypothetical protein
MLIVSGLNICVNNKITNPCIARGLMPVLR